MAQTATILVTDLAGSTETRVQLGEARAEKLRRAPIRCSRSRRRRMGGM